MLLQDMCILIKITTSCECYLHDYYLAVNEKVVHVTVNQENRNAHQ